MSRTAVTLGYIPLTDAALPILALEMGFAAEEGIDLTLSREPSWATIRDKVAMGVYPAAHMLSPLALSLSLGIGPMPVDIVAPMVLGTNGNVLVASRKLSTQLQAEGADFDDARATGRALASYCAAHGLRVGVPFPHSMHRELVRFLIERSGADTQKIDFLTAPPRILPDVMAADEVDLIMVGEPWGSCAVDAGVGEIILPGCAIWSGAPEKVLALRNDWLTNERDTAEALIRALYRASLWIADKDHIASTAEILALPRYLNTPSLLIERALKGEFGVNDAGQIARAHGALVMSGVSATFPWRSGAAWIAGRAAASWGLDRHSAMAQASETFRPDVYRTALAPLGVNLPLHSTKLEGRLSEACELPGQSGFLMLGPDAFFDGSEFDPEA